MRVLAVVHHRNAAAGVFAEPALAAGHELVEWLPHDEPAPPADGFDAAMVFGGSMNVDEEDAHPWLRQEKRFVRELIERGTPLLGICRGAQAINVACGGTLHQHIPGHRQSDPGPTTTHEVEIVAGTRLAGVLGPGALAVNSFHHQAVDRLGHGLRISARAADGTVEAIEGLGFALGVQWHAETLADGRLFEALVGAATVPLLKAA
jgi:putative glutamine amidotransferase